MIYSKNPVFLVDMQPTGPRRAFAWRRVPRLLHPLCFAAGGLLWAFGQSITIRNNGLFIGVEYYSWLYRLFEMSDGSWHFKLGA